MTERRRSADPTLLRESALTDGDDPADDPWLHTAGWPERDAAEALFIDRTDQRVHDEVCERLRAHGEIDSRELTVSVWDGDVTLRGVIRDRRMKRAAEDCAERVEGVRQVFSQLRVDPEGE